MRTAIIVQARIGSTRLPGKVLKPLNGHTVLEEVLQRCRAIPGADVVVCAIPVSSENDALIAPSTRTGAVVTRGSAGDVLARYHQAAGEVGADVVMRVTSDCPLIDPALCGDVLALRTAEQADYAANNMPPSFPHGLDCEAFTAVALARAHVQASDAYDREHVTPWLRRDDSVKRVALAGPGGTAVAQRWALDFPEDYAFLSALFAKLPAGRTRWQDTLAVVAANPQISTLNATRRAR